MEVLQPYRLWVDCEHKTVKPDSSTPFIHHSCKLDPEEKLEGSCEVCPFGKAPDPMFLKEANIRREGHTIQYKDKDDEAFWKCPNCGREYVYERADKEGWKIFRCQGCVNSYIDWSRAYLNK